MNFKLSIDSLPSNVQTVDGNNYSMSFVLEIPDDSTTNYYGKNVFIQNLADDNGLKNNVYDNPINLQKFKVTLNDRSNTNVNLNNADWWGVIELIIVVDNSPDVLSTTDYVAPNQPTVPEYLLKNGNRTKYPWLL